MRRRGWRVPCIRVFVSALLLPMWASVSAARSDPAPLGEWIRLGIGGGGFLCAPAFDRADPGKIYIGSDVTGVFQSVNGGANWAASARGLSDYYIQSLVVHPDNPSMLFAATNQGVSRSTDGGVTWETVLEKEVSAPNRHAAGFACVTVDPINSKIVWAGIGTFRDTSGSEGGDTAYEHAHVWRSVLEGATGSWEPIAGPWNTAGVHTILPVPEETDPSHPGADAFLLSGTNGVWYAAWSAWYGQWMPSPRMGSAPNDLPHADARDLEAKVDASGRIERLYLVLNSHWLGSYGPSVYWHAQGYGGGVWYSDDMGANWLATSFFDGTDGLHLEEGDSQGNPKNMRHVAVDQENGAVYIALNVREMSNEGVWRAQPMLGWHWQRMTESRTSQDDYNMEKTYFPTLSRSDGLAVRPGTGDVVFTTSTQAWRCPGGNCVPGGENAEEWEALHTDQVGTNGESYRTSGIDLTFAYDMTVAPSDTSAWLLATADLGLLRSDDRGTSWRRIPAQTDSNPAPYDRYTNRNCKGILAVPESPTDEYIGLFGDGGVTEVWYNAGVPGDDTTWTRLDDPLLTGGVVEDVLVMAKSQGKIDVLYVVVATTDGIVAGYKSSVSDWVFFPWMNGIPSANHSRLAKRLAAGPGTPPNRRILVSFVKNSGDEGGLYYANQFGGQWNAAIGPENLKNVRSFHWSDDDPFVVYAGSGASAYYGSGMAAVLRSADAGITWSVLTGEIGGYDNDCFDVKDLAEVNGKLYAGIALLGRNGPYYPDCFAETFGGVFASEDGGVTWQDVSNGLDQGDMAFVRADGTNPDRLLAGTIGNGPYFRLVDGFLGAKSAERPRRPERSRVIASPNPFRGGSVIRFRLAEESAVTVRVYDLSGRLVRTLVGDDHRGAGVHRVSWNGENDAGRPVAAGTYFVRLLLPDESRVEKAVLLR